MPTKPTTTTLADALREAIQNSELSYNELARLAKADQGTISRFMLGQRDLTLAVASRLCLVLGFGLMRVGTALTEPLDNPPLSNRKKPKKRPPPASAVQRGQGRRVDLEGQEAVSANATTTQVGSGTSAGVKKRRPAESTGGNSVGGHRRKK